MDQLRIALLFFSTLKEVLKIHNTDHYILCGDFNLVQNPKLDTVMYKDINNPRARLAVLDMINELELIDFYRNLNLDTHRNTWRSKSKLGFYVPFNSQGHIGTGPQRNTWRKKNSVKQARLD